MLLTDRAVTYPVGTGDHHRGRPVWSTPSARATAPTPPTPTRARPAPARRARTASAAAAARCRHRQSTAPTSPRAPPTPDACGLHGAAARQRAFSGHHRRDPGHRLSPRRYVDGTVTDARASSPRRYPTGGFNGFYIQTPGRATPRRAPPTRSSSSAARRLHRATPRSATRSRSPAPPSRAAVRRRPHRDHVADAGRRRRRSRRRSARRPCRYRMRLPRRPTPRARRTRASWSTLTGDFTVTNSYTTNSVRRDRPRRRQPRRCCSPPRSARPAPPAAQRGRGRQRRARRRSSTTASSVNFLDAPTQRRHALAHRCRRPDSRPSRRSGSVPPPTFTAAGDPRVPQQRVEVPAHHPGDRDNDDAVSDVRRTPAQPATRERRRRPQARHRSTS